MLSIAFSSLSGCAALGKKPTPPPLDLHFQFCEVVPTVQLACLPEADVIALRKALIECGSKDAK